MVKKSANPWLRTLLRAGKQQRSVTRALTSLLAAPALRPKPKLKPKPKPAVAARPAPAAARKPAAKAPPVAPASGKWLAFHYTPALSASGGPARRMAYWLYLPDNTVPGAPVPLIVMLHGCDQSATLFARGTRMNQWAEKKGYAVVYPQQSASAHPHRCWKWYDRATQQGGGDVGAIVGIVGKVMAAYPIDRARIYICGISAGAAMANIVALNHPELFAAVGLHSSPLFGAGHSPIGALGVMKHGASHRVDSAIEEVLLARPGFPPLPTMLIQGEDDEVVRPINQEQLQRQAMLLNRLHPGSPVEVALKPGGRRVLTHRIHDVRSGRQVMLRVARIAQLKHAWSGGDERVAYHSGPGPDASKMLLEFFSKHSRKW